MDEEAIHIDRKRNTKGTPVKVIEEIEEIEETVSIYLVAFGITISLVSLLSSTQSLYSPCK